MRGLDHQGTMGTWVGETVLRGQIGTMRSARYADGANYLFPEAEVRAARPNV
jgi:branched-chain amino acid transport system substrate-binding protein